MTIFNDGIELHSMVGRSVVRDGIVNRFELVVSWWAFNLTFYRDNFIINNIVAAVNISCIRCRIVIVLFIVHWKNPSIVGFNWIHDFPVLLFSLYNFILCRVQHFFSHLFAVVVVVVAACQRDIWNGCLNLSLISKAKYFVVLILCWWQVAWTFLCFAAFSLMQCKNHAGN